jgi:YesN/AraC family two-component response regulator
MSHSKKCLEAGMDEYLYKLLNPQELCGMLEKWIEKMESSRRSAVEFLEIIEGTIYCGSPNIYKV